MGGGHDSDMVFITTDFLLSSEKQVVLCAKSVQPAGGTSTHCLLILCFSTGISLLTDNHAGD